MTAVDATALNNLLIDVQSLKYAMEKTMAGTTEDHAKWMTFKSVARSHGALANRYLEITGEGVPVYDHEKMKGSTDTIWPIMKQIFDGVFAELVTLEGRLKGRLQNGVPVGFDDLLHVNIRNAAIKHFQNGDYRNASLDSVVALFDLLREKSELDMDGEALCNQAFSPGAPILILSELDTESGKNDQRGFMDMFKGFYRGVRNPKAHSLVHDLDAVKSAQHLVVASMLARRLDDATRAPLASASTKANTTVPTPK